MQSARFWARSDDCAHTRIGKRLKHATWAQRYFERLIFIFAAFRAIEESRCRRSVYDQILPILKVQETNDPGYAGLYFHFSEIQFLCDIVVVQTFTQRAINWTKDARLFPKAAHNMPPT